MKSFCYNIREWYQRSMFRLYKSPWVLYTHHDPQISFWTLVRSNLLSKTKNEKMNGYLHVSITTYEKPMKRMNDPATTLKQLWFVDLRDGQKVGNNYNRDTEKFIPHGKSRNWPEKALWNKGLNVVVCTSYMKLVRTSKTYVFSIFSYMFLFVVIFSYVCSAPYMFGITLRGLEEALGSCSGEFWKFSGACLEGFGRWETNMKPTS